ncbi:MBL fold metallo-hydrolase [Luteolibacter algae]|uniref:MBL fold metallo-hydrolase n=1 Tax=Luteolibacter algae TaxID=454151 RepID=A0ABW5D9N7_9BACT
MSTDHEYLTFLGTGTSVGVPVIGCRCMVCTSTDPCNNRTRSSILIKSGGTSLLVDSGPDLREQALREKISSIDAVIYTHSHLDHVVGFDELRAFCWHRQDPLPLYATQYCLDVLKNMFAWAFDAGNSYPGYIKPDPRIVAEPFQFGSLGITPLPVIHGSVVTVGYLFETKNAFRFAYLPDVKTIPESTLSMMEDLDLLIIDSLRNEPHATHLSVPESLEIAKRLSPARTIFTHISHDIDHATLSAELPPGISLAHDGLHVALID